jgi:putative flippase GtrA
MITYKTLKDKFISKFGQIIKYGLVGVINTLITGIILFVLMRGFGVSYKTSNAVGYVAGFINSFIMNKFWTFKANQTSTIRQFLRFSAVFAICYLLQLGFVILLVEKLSINKDISQLLEWYFIRLLDLYLIKYLPLKININLFT